MLGGYAMLCEKKLKLLHMCQILSKQIEEEISKIGKEEERERWKEEKRKRGKEEKRKRGKVLESEDKLENGEK